jgi:RNA polymerase sigma factor (sigma-70 family)
MTLQAGLGAEPVNLNAIVADQAAFRDWYEQGLPRVYRYLLARSGGDADLAEELTQQTFVEGVRRRRSFDGRSDAVTWLCGIGRHKLVDHYRRSGREHQRHLRIASECPPAILTSGRGTSCGLVCSRHLPSSPASSGSSWSFATWTRCRSARSHPPSDAPRRRPSPSSRERVTPSAAPTELQTDE